MSGMEWCGGNLTSTADSRLLLCPNFSVPIVKFEMAFDSHPDGGGEDGEMPTGTAWAKLVAAKKSGPRKLVDRMLKCESGLL